MGFVGKIAKTTENSAIKYKSLYFSDLYLIFRRFSILFIDLITVHEVLPHDVCRGGDGGDGVEERLRHPDRKHGVFLPERLAARDGIAVTTSYTAAYAELQQAYNQRRTRQSQLHRAVGLVVIEQKAGRAAYDDGKRHEPYVKRYLAVVGHPTAHTRQESSAHLSRHERRDEQRSDLLQDLPHGARAVAEGVQHERRAESHRHIAQQTVSGHSLDIRAQHSAYDDGGHSDGSQNADHGSLSHHAVERRQRIVYREATRRLKQQQPRVHPRQADTSRIDAAESEKEHRKDECGGQHVVSHTVQPLYFTTQ